MDNSYQIMQNFQYLYASIRECINRAIQQGREFGLTINEILHELNTTYAPYFHGQITEQDVARVLSHQINGLPLFETATRTVDNEVLWKPYIPTYQNRGIQQPAAPGQQMQQIPPFPPGQQQPNPPQAHFAQYQQQRYNELQRDIQLYMHQQKMQQISNELDVPLGQTVEELEMEIADLKKRRKPLIKRNERLKQYYAMLNQPQLLEEKPDKILDSTVYYMKDAHIMVDEKVNSLIQFLDSELNVQG